jgi:hypothetical protein
MRHLTINLTKVTSNTNLFLYVNALHLDKPSHCYRIEMNRYVYHIMAIGNRLP